MGAYDSRQLVRLHGALHMHRPLLQFSLLARFVNLEDQACARGEPIVGAAVDHAIDYGSSCSESGRDAAEARFTSLRARFRCKPAI